MVPAGAGAALFDPPPAAAPADGLEPSPAEAVLASVLAPVAAADGPEPAPLPELVVKSGATLEPDGVAAVPVAEPEPGEAAGEPDGAAPVGELEPGEAGVVPAVPPGVFVDPVAGVDAAAPFEPAAGLPGALDASDPSGTVGGRSGAAADDGFAAAGETGPAEGSELAEVVCEDAQLDGVGAGAPV
ncbi:MAG: hypothetical protein JO039_10400, partial [Solirubrobacterales bacterium]|nr:hypothetical protein [Solirubrobacterales bacterium]